MASEDLVYVTFKGGTKKDKTVVPNVTVAIRKAALECLPDSVLSIMYREPWSKDSNGRGTEEFPLVTNPFDYEKGNHWDAAMAGMIKDAYNYHLKYKPDNKVQSKMKLNAVLDLSKVALVLDYYGLDTLTEDGSLLLWKLETSMKLNPMAHLKAKIFQSHLAMVPWMRDLVLSSFDLNAREMEQFVFVSRAGLVSMSMMNDIELNTYDRFVRMGKDDLDPQGDKCKEAIESPYVRERLLRELEAIGFQAEFIGEEKSDDTRAMKASFDRKHMDSIGICHDVEAPDGRCYIALTDQEQFRPYGRTSFRVLRVEIPNLYEN
jgi:hypothetical protein